MMEILEYAFFRNALIAVAVISIVSAIVGTYVVSRRMVFITGGITHASFGGLGLGFFLGMNPTLMAAIAAVSAGLLVEWLSGKGKVREDSAIGVVWALGMALGTIFIFLTPGYVPELTSFLFGNILTITTGDLWLFGGYGVVLLGAFACCYERILMCAFDKDFAATRGLNPRLVNGAMMVLTALCVVLTIRLIGIMLLLSLLTLPQMISERWARGFAGMMVLSAIVSVVSGVTGLMCSYWFDVPASAAIVLILIALYVISRLVKIRG